MTAFQRAYEGWLYEDGSLPLAQQAHELASMAGFTKGNLYEAAADWRFMYDGAMLEEVGLWEEKM